MRLESHTKGSLAIESYQPSSDTYGIKKIHIQKRKPGKVIRLFDVAKPYSAPESAAEEDRIKVPLITVPQ